MNFSKFSSTNDTLGSLNGVCILTKGYYARPQYSILKHMWGLQVHDDCKTYLYYIYCQVKHSLRSRCAMWNMMKDFVLRLMISLSSIYLRTWLSFSLFFSFFSFLFFLSFLFSHIFPFFLFAQPMSLFARLLERDESNFAAWTIFIWLQEK